MPGHAQQVAHHVGNHQGLVGGEAVRPHLGHYAEHGERQPAKNRYLGQEYCEMESPGEGWYELRECTCKLLSSGKNLHAAQASLTFKETTYPTLQPQPPSNSNIVPGTSHGPTGALNKKQPK